MSKKSHLFTITVVSLILIFTTSLAGLSQGQSFETYENPNLGFTINYPSGWGVGETGSSEDTEDTYLMDPWNSISDVIISSPEVNEDGVSQAGISVSVIEPKEEEYLDPDTMTIKSRITPNLTSREIVEGWKKSNLFGNENIRENETTFGAGNYSASRVDVLPDENPMPDDWNYYSSVIYSVYDGKIYGIHAEIDDLAVPENLPTIQKMLDSFQITQAGNATGNEILPEPDCDQNPDAEGCNQDDGSTNGEGNGDDQSTDEEDDNDSDEDEEN